MPYLQCPKCGLSNWSTHRQCLRCYTPLPAIDGSAGPQPTVPFYHQNPRRKKLLIGVALVALLVVIGGGVLTYSLPRNKKVANPYPAIETALRDSSEFNIPVVVEAGRYKFYNQDEGRRVDQEATPEAYALDSLGLLYIHHGMYADAPMTRNKDGGYVIDPLSGAPYQYKHVELEITQNGQAQSAVWDPYENKKDAKDGWRVPIGERELVRVVQVVKNYLGQPISDAAWVSFTWRWKPNELGQSFDKRSPSYRVTSERMKFPTSPFSFSLVVNDSRAFYWGTADLIRGSGGWEAHHLSWAGPEGVTLAPDISDEALKLIEDAKSH
jgi:hypothetical protein